MSSEENRDLSKPILIQKKNFKGQLDLQEFKVKDEETQTVVFDECCFDNASFITYTHVKFYFMSNCTISNNSASPEKYEMVDCRAELQMVLDQPAEKGKSYTSKTQMNDSSVWWQEFQCSK